MKLRNRIIKWLGGVAADDHQWFVDELLAIIGDTAIVVRSDTNVHDFRTDKPVILSGKRIHVSHLRLENRARIICDPTAKDLMLTSIIAIGKSCDASYMSQGLVVTASPPESAIAPPGRADNPLPE